MQQNKWKTLTGRKLRARQWLNVNVSKQSKYKNTNLKAVFYTDILRCTMNAT